MRGSIISFEQAPACRRGICIVEGTNVAGTRHVAGIRERAALYGSGTEFTFVRDPDNAYDRWAVEVFDPSNERIGYVSCDCNEVVARLLDGGKRVFGRCDGVVNLGGWTCIEMGVYLDD